MRGSQLALCLFLAATAQAAQTLVSTTVSPNTYSSFIQVQNMRFVDQKCLEFPVVGFNGWELMESAAGAANFSEVDGMDAVHYTFSEAARSGFTVVRMFGHGINSTLALQTAPGVYDQTAFEGLDKVIDAAAQYGLRLIVTMADAWNLVDSIKAYAAWANLTDYSEFFWNPTTAAMYQAHLVSMTGRVNTVNGLAYKDDPTIFAWDLMNEPRCDCFPHAIDPSNLGALPLGCQPQCADNVTTWISEMATFLKQADPNHLITVGEEGFWGWNSQGKASNPGVNWAALTGDNFTAQHAPAAIDFAAFHYWPDLWTPNVTDTAFLQSWLQTHEAAAAALGKPLILEEFGKNASIGQGYASLEQSIKQQRAPVFQTIYEALNTSLATDGPLRGVLFWQWGMGPRNDDSNNIEVAAGDFDFETIVVPTAQAILQGALSAGSLPSCLQGPSPPSASAQQPPLVTSLPVGTTTSIESAVAG